MSIDTHFTPVDDVLAIDAGTGTWLTAIIRNGKPVTLKGPDGVATPAAVFREANGNVVVGSVAERMGHKDPSSYFSGFKPLMEKSGHEPLSADGDFTVIDAFAALFRHALELGKKTTPRLAGYPQLGGSKHPADKLRIAVTIPAAGFGLQQIAHLKEALVKGGLPEEHVDDVVFFKEPHAAATAALAERGLRGQMRNGDIIAVLDFGAGTSDFSILEYRDGLLDARCPHSGICDLGGTNETAAIAAVIGEQLGKTFKAFERGRGFTFAASGIKANEREEQYYLMRAAEEAKHQLFLSEQVTVAAQTKKGNREVNMTQKDACAAWESMFAEIDAALANAFGDSGLTWADVTQVVVAGGGCRTAGKLQRVAKATGKAPEDLVVCEEPAEAIVCGASLMAWNPGEVDTVTVDAIGLTYPHAVTGQPVNEVYIPNGKTIPAGGLDVTKATTVVKSTGGSQEVSLYPFITKPQVQASEGDLLKDSELVTLTPVAVTVDLPAGEHDCAVRMRHDVTGKAMSVLSFPGVEGSESIVVPLEVAEHAEPPKFAVSDIVVVFDMSSSMGGSPLEEAKAATKQFLQNNLLRGCRVAVVNVGGERAPGTALPFTTDLQKSLDTVASFEAAGGTPMTEGLQHTATLCDPQNNPAVVLFSDGYPNCKVSVEEAASTLKNHADLFTIAIGPGADHQLLERLATSKEHFFPVGRAGDLKFAFQAISTLLYTGERTRPESAVAPAAPEAQPETSAPATESNGWDDQDASGWEEVA